MYFAISECSAFAAYVGGPNVTISAHNRASRQASAAQVVLTDGVSPAPPTTGQVVSMHVYITATRCWEPDCTVYNVIEAYPCIVG